MKITVTQSEAKQLICAAFSRVYGLTFVSDEVDIVPDDNSKPKFSPGIVAFVKAHGIPESGLEQISLICKNSGANKITVIKEVRRNFGVGLKEAKDLIESVHNWA